MDLRNLEMMDQKEFRQRLQSVRCFALDLDGTFYLGNTLFPFSADFLRKVEKTGRRYLFMTNNSSLSPREYVQKFKALGLEIAEECIYTSADATAEYLLKYGPGHRLFVLGTEALMRFFERKGFILEPDRPDAVVLGFDLDFDYSRFHHAARLLRRGVPFFATHPDRNCPIENGDWMPDCGALSAALTAATGVKPRFFGKPFRPMVEGMLRRARVARGELAVVGDRLSTDIRTGRDNGLLSILVLTGETRPETLQRSSIQPDFVVESLAALMEFL